MSGLPVPEDAVSQTGEQVMTWPFAPNPLRDRLPKSGAGGPAPPDLPALETQAQEPLTMHPLKAVARDFKVQAAGE